MSPRKTATKSQPDAAPRAAQRPAARPKSPPESAASRAVMARPSAADPLGISQLQRLVGNRAVQRFLAPSEAAARPHHAADLNPRSIEIHRSGEAAGAQRALAEGEPLQAKSTAPGEGFETGPDFEQRLQATRGAGHPLPADTRRTMESRFGADFSTVRLHTGAPAEQLSREVSAQAFTHGSDIYLGHGKDNLASADGQQLLAHELTHTIQQGAAPTQPVQRIVDVELDQLRAIDAKFFAKQGRKVIALLEAYNRHMHSGDRPGPEQTTQLTQANQMLMAMFRASERSVQQGAGVEAQRAIVRDVAIRLTTEIEELGQYREIVNGRKLGRGQVNTVYKVLFADNWEAVWKADEPQLGEGVAGLARGAGMPTAGNANLGGRNMAMSRLDELLGTGVIPRTERAMFGAKAGTVMEMVKGKQLGSAVFNDQDQPVGSKALNVDYAHPEIQRGLSNLQILDAIAGQFDRHAGNIMVEVDAHNQIKGIKGIDNDFAFGVNMKPNTSGRVSHERGLPRFVDIETAHNINRVSAADVRATLAGLLTGPEIERTVQRFEYAQSYCRALIRYAENPALAVPANGPPNAAQANLPENAAARGQLVHEWNPETEAANFAEANARVNQAGGARWAFARVASGSYAWEGKDNLATQQANAANLAPGDHSIRIETL